MNEALDIRTQGVIGAAKRFLENSTGETPALTPDMLRGFLDLTQQAQKPDEVYLAVLHSPSATPLLYPLQKIRALSDNDADTLRLFSKFLGYIYWKVSTTKK